MLKKGTSLTEEIIVNICLEIYGVLRDPREKKRISV